MQVFSLDFAAEPPKKPRRTEGVRKKKRWLMPLQGGISQAIGC